MKVFSRQVKLLLKAAILMLPFAIAPAFVAAQVSFSISNEQALPGQSVTVEWTYDGDGSAAGFEGRFNFDPADVDAVDYDNCLDGWQANSHIGQCLDQGGTEDNVFFQVADQGLAALPSGSGFVEFQISAAASPGTIIDLEWVEGAFAVDGNPDINSTNGQIEIIDAPPEELSALTVTPDPLDFGTVDLGNMPQTLDITAENTGGSASSLTISAAAYNGDPEFSIVANGCDGTTLGAGDTCSVTVEFDAAADGSFTGAVDFSSDADDNPNPSVSVLGSADSVAALSINPPSGNVNLGSGLQGDVLSTNAVISNNGSADGTFDCTLTDPSGVFSADPLNGTVAAGGSESVALSCSLPAEAEDGDSFAATFSCTGSEGFSSEHELSCSVSEWEPLPVPTMQKWSLILFALMMLIAGGIGIRFFRA